MKGIFITSLNPSGAAASDGRIQTGDRILKVDGHSLSGLENMEAAAVLRNSGNPIKLVLGRKRNKLLSPPDGSQPSMTPELPPPVSSVAQSPDQSHDQDGAATKPEGSDVQEGEEAGESPGVGEGGEGEGEAAEERSEDGRTEGAMEAILEPDRERELIEKWTKALGPGYSIKVCL